MARAISDAMWSKYLNQAASDPGDWGSVKYIVIHHDALPQRSWNGLRTVEAYERTHLRLYGRRSYNGGIISPNGNIYTEWPDNPMKHYGAHAVYRKKIFGEHPANWVNRNSIAICVQGEFERQDTPKAEQKDKLEWMIGQVAGRFGITKDRIIAHKHVGNTDCCGMELLADLPAIISRALAQGECSIEQIRERPVKLIIDDRFVDTLTWLGGKLLLPSGKPVREYYEARGYAVYYNASQQKVYCYKKEAQG